MDITWLFIPVFVGIALTIDLVRKKAAEARARRALKASVARLESMRRHPAGSRMADSRHLDRVGYDWTSTIL